VRVFGGLVGGRGWAAVLGSGAAVPTIRCATVSGDPRWTILNWLGCPLLRATVLEEEILVHWWLACKSGPGWFLLSAEKGTEVYARVIFRVVSR
jgi:hypothetical protein